VALTGDASEVRQVLLLTIAGDVMMEYDADGNLISDGRWTYAWDGENRLTNMMRNVESPAGARQQLTFEYDAEGRRIRKQYWTNSGSGFVAQSTNLFLYDGWNLIGELNASGGGRLRTYIWGTDLSGTMAGAGGVGGLLLVADYTTGTTNFVAYDGNGNVAALTDAATGAASARYDYGPFGEPLRATGLVATNNPIRFSTKYTDSQSGFLYYGFRYYNPSTGRWISRDPIEEAGGSQLYVFGRNGPLTSIDILGLVEHRFEVVRGDPTSDASILGAAGRWGQPWWCASGSYSIVDTLADSTVTITSRDAPGGACNSVDDPDPAGTIKLYLRDECPGEFDVLVAGLISVSGTGPRGAARGKLEARGKLIISVFGTTSSPVTKAGADIVRIRLAKGWKLVAKYTPTLSLPQGAVQSSGTAYGIVQFV